MPVRFQQLLHLWFVVKRRVIHDNEAIGAKLGQQAVLHPGNDGVMRAAFLE